VGEGTIEFGGFDQDWLDNESEEESLENIDRNVLRSLCGEYR
jgi:hypothetical protein